MSALIWLNSYARAVKSCRRESLSAMMMGSHHVRGADVNGERIVHRSIGSPPRVRGKEIFVRLTRCVAGIIPAYAGKS